MNHINLDFFPSEARAKTLDMRMRRELAESLTEIVSQINTQLPNSTTSTLANQIIGLLPDLCNNPEQRINPAFFANYYQLVLAILNEHEIELALKNLIQSATYSQQIQFKNLHADDLGSNANEDLYRLCLDTDPNFRFEFLSPEQADSERTQNTILRALTLLENIAPELAMEFRALTHEIILAAAPKNAAARFDGGSSYMLWGTLALSVDDDKTDLAMMETLAHEAGHSFLFGLTIEEPLVNNDDNDLYQSPLRVDPRPMDGIYHATFVSARMHYAMQMAKKSGKLTPEEIQECERYLTASRKAFFDGYGVIEHHAILSTTGKTIIENAMEYMQENSHGKF